MTYGEQAANVDEQSRGSLFTRLRSYFVIIPVAYLCTGIMGSLSLLSSVFDRDGRVFGCSGDTFYRYRDRYTLAGQRRGDALTVREVAVAPEDHPCLHGASRHLDTATGAMAGEHIVLTWRGQRRQVLHRP